METIRVARDYGTVLASLALLLVAQPLHAQDAPPTGDAPPPEAVEVPVIEGRQVYTPADFIRFAPRNAYDMLRQVPAFQLRENDQRRGLGQATGNILIDGKRPANKSDELETQLSRIPAANVVRIEIVDGSTLDIPGLVGQVANIVVKADDFSGQFTWQPEFRAHYADPLATKGEVSVTGRAGAVAYEVGFSNLDASRSAAGGPTLIYNANGTIRETRDDVWSENLDAPKAAAKLTIDGPGDSLAHLNGHYQFRRVRFDERGLREGPLLVDRLRTVATREDTWNAEIGGDYEFGLGPGRLTLIGLYRRSHEPFEQTVITRFADGSPATGDRFSQTGEISEKIARGEYTWKLFGGDWQLAGEAAFNSLDNVAESAILSPAGEFVVSPFPGGTGKVSEDRYDGSLSFGRAITPTLSVQLIAAAEYSTIRQSGVGGLTRKFFRPKGQVSLAWKPSSDFDISAKLQRRVGQLSFYDFLGRVFLDNDNENAGNASLVPQQDWTIEIEANKVLGPWGSTKVRLIRRYVTDYVTIVPVPGGESIGNVPKALAEALDWTGTLQGEPLGWKGAKLDFRLLLQRAELDDPFTGMSRSYNNFTDRLVELRFRHDIPGSNWAWGADLEHSHNQPEFRQNEVGTTIEGPVWLHPYVENKNLFGLTVRATASNVLGARSFRDRTVFTGLRGATPIDFIEDRDRRIGPIFQLSVKGGF
jgi:outer membrane receptor for ferrienterochelin and colicins